MLVDCRPSLFVDFFACLQGLHMRSRLSARFTMKICLNMASDAKADTMYVASDVKADTTNVAPGVKTGTTGSSRLRGSIQKA